MTCSSSTVSRRSGSEVSGELVPGKSGFDFRAAIAEERRQAHVAGKAFAAACKTGDVDAFLAAVDSLNVTGDSWRYALKKVADWRT
jgi:hypothetical protein